MIKEEKMKQIIQFIDKWWTILLLSFCVYMAERSVAILVSENFIDVFKLNPIILQSIMIFIGVCGARVLLYEIYSELGRDWRAPDEEDTFVDKAQVEFLYFVAVVGLYFATICGLVILFYPSAGSLNFHGQRYSLGTVFTTTAILIYAFYRVFLFRVTCITSEEEGNDN